MLNSRAGIEALMRVDVTKDVCLDHSKCNLYFNRKSEWRICMYVIIICSDRRRSTTMYIYLLWISKFYDKIQIQPYAAYDKNSPKSKLSSLTSFCPVQAGSNRNSAQVCPLTFTILNITTINNAKSTLRTTVCTESISHEAMFCVDDRYHHVNK